MGEPVSRFLYRCLLRLHPEAFRREFADEMLWIFDELTARKSSVPLVVDAAASLARQWILGMPWKAAAPRNGPGCRGCGIVRLATYRSSGAAAALVSNDAGWRRRTRSFLSAVVCRISPGAQAGRLKSRQRWR